MSGTLSGINFNCQPDCKAELHGVAERDYENNVYVYSSIPGSHELIEAPLRKILGEYIEKVDDESAFFINPITSLPVLNFVEEVGKEVDEYVKES